MTKRQRGGDKHFSLPQTNCVNFATVFTVTQGQTSHPSAENTPANTPRKAFYQGLEEVHQTIDKDTEYTPHKGTAHHLAHMIGITLFDTTPVKCGYNKAKQASLPTLSSPQYRDHLKTIIYEAITETLSLYSNCSHLITEIFVLCTESLRNFTHAMRSETTEELGELLASGLQKIPLIPQNTKIISSQKAQLITECFAAIKEDQGKGFGALLSSQKTLTSHVKMLDLLSKEYLVPQSLLSRAWEIFSQLDQRSQNSQASTLTKSSFAALENNKYFDTIEFQQKCFLENFKKSFFDTKNKTPQYQKCTIPYSDDDTTTENPEHTSTTAKKLFIAAKFNHRQTELAAEELTESHADKSCVVTYDPRGLTTVHTLYHTGSLASKLPSLDTYISLSRDFQKLTKTYSDIILSRAIFDQLKGINIATQRYNDQGLDESTIKFLSDVSYLLFSTEACRTPSAAIVNAMFIDLVQNGNESLCNITKLPIATPKIMPALRALNTLSGNHIYDRAPKHKISHIGSEAVHTTLKKTNDIVFPWLRMNGLEVEYPLSTDPTKIKTVVDLVESAVIDWFGIEIHRGTYPDIEISGLESGLQDIAV